MSNIKYPRTPHLPWSQGKTDDDKTLSSIKHFDGMNLIVTIKMDGENTTMTSDKVYARSVDSADYILTNSVSWNRKFHPEIVGSVYSNIDITNFITYWY